MNLGEACDEYERLIGKGKVKWKPVPKRLSVENISLLARLSDFPGSGNKVKVEVGDVRIGGSYIFRITGHPMVRYVDAFPKAEKWMLVKDDRHTQSLHPDELLAWEMSRQGFKTKLLIDNHGRSTLSVGDHAVVHDSRDRLSWAKEEA